MVRASGWTAAALVLAVSASPALAAPYQPAPAPVVSWLSLAAPGPYQVGSTLVLESDAVPGRADATLDDGHVVLRGDHNTWIDVLWSPEHGDFRREITATDVSGTYRFDAVHLNDDFDGQLSCSETECRSTAGERTPPQSLPAAVEIDADPTADVLAPVVSQVRLLSGTAVQAGDVIEAVSDAADANGIQYAAVSLRGPGGRSFALEQHAGQDRMALVVPASLPNGTYAIDGLSAHDPRGNVTHCDAGGTCTTSDGATFPVDYGTGTVTLVAQADLDVSAPTLADPEFLTQPGVGIGEELRLRTGVTDAVGTIGGGVSLRGPENRWVYLQIGSDGVASGKVPATAVAGTYVLDHLFAFDGNGNALHCSLRPSAGCVQYGEGELPDVDLDAVRIEIAGHEDHDPPLPVRKPVLSTTSTSAGRVVTLDPGLDGSELTAAEAHFASAPGSEEPSTLSFRNEPGEHTLRGYVPRAAASPEYRLNGLTAQDAAGNELYCSRRSCYDETYQRLGDWDAAGVTLTVTPALPDTGVPTLTALSPVSPLEQPSGSSVELLVDATDDSGYWVAEVDLRNLTDGGTWGGRTSWSEQGRVSVPLYWVGDWLPDGRYQVQRLQLSDEAGNAVTCFATRSTCTTSDGGRVPAPALLTFSIGDVGDPGDTTAPTVAGVLERAPDQAGWYNRPVRVDWSVADAAPSSGIATRPTPLVIAEDGAAVTAKSAPACDRSGNCGTGSVTVRMDRTPPGVSLGAGTARHTVDQQVEVRCTAADAVSGVASSDCVSSSRPAYAYPLGDTSLKAAATDVAGNTGTATTVVRVDLTYDGLQGLGDRFAEAPVSRLALTVALRRVRAGVPGDFDAAVRAYQDQVRRDTGAALDEGEAAVLLRLSAALQPSTPA